MKCLPIEKELGVELARSPAVEDGAYFHGVHAGVDDLQRVNDRLKVRSRSRNGADVQVAIRQSVDSLADAGGDGVVHRRVADRARETDRAERALGVEKPDHTDNRLQFEQLQRHCGVVEIDPAVLDRLDHRRWQHSGVDFQTQVERLLWAHLSDGQMQLKLTAPKGFIAKGVEPKDLTPVLD